MGKNKKGFTVIELLIVIVIIGVLFSIAIFSYSSIRKNAIGSLLSSNLGRISEELSRYEIENNSLPVDIDEVNNEISSFLSPDVTIQEYFNDGPESFCISVINTNVSYRLANYGEPRLGQCARPTKDRFSLIKWNAWTVGTGNITGYRTYGDGNSRILDTNPWGQTDVVWDVSDQDAVGDADGGWNGNTFTIDNKKTYRFTVFVRRKFIGNGYFLFGTFTSPNSILHRSNGLTTTNPYFTSTWRQWWGSANDWYLAVGHIWPVGSGVGESKPETGIYDMNGNKILTISDFVWDTTNTTAMHRVYLYNSTNILTNQQMYQPRVDVVDGSEPTINELIKNSY